MSVGGGGREGEKAGSGGWEKRESVREGEKGR